MVHILGFKVWGLGFEVETHLAAPPAARCAGVKGIEMATGEEREDTCVSVWGLGFRVSGSGFRV